MERSSCWTRALCLSRASSRLCFSDCHLAVASRYSGCCLAQLGELCLETCNLVFQCLDSLPCNSLCCAQVCLGCCAGVHLCLQLTLALLQFMDAVLQASALSATSRFKSISFPFQPRLQAFIFSPHL